MWRCIVDCVPNTSCLVFSALWQGEHLVAGNAKKHGIRASVGKDAQNNYDDVAKVQRLLNRHVPTAKLKADGLCGPKTNTAIYSFQMTSFGKADGRVDRGGRTITALEGPTTPIAAIASAIEALDDTLLSKNQLLAAQLMKRAALYRKQDDLRWFFTYAHGRISEQINLHIRAFERPNALIRLNMHFGSEYLRAISGLPHDQWKEGFLACKVIQTVDVVLKTQPNAPFGLPLETEACGAVMANIHIQIDLKNALSQVGCIPAQDYGNVLLFVQNGADDAIKQLQGEIPGTIEVALKSRLPDWLQMEKKWRNAVYEEVCQVPVPDPVPNFAKPTAN
jgi:hypothetical protein